MSIYLKITYAKFISCLIFALSVSFSVNSASAETCLAFVSQNNKIIKEIASNVSQALMNANICHTIDYFPEKRADYLFKEEKYDGFLMRSSLFETRSILPVVKIDPPIIQTTGVILSREADIKNIEDLNGRSIGIVRGWLWMESLTRQYPRVVKAHSVFDLANLLKERRLDTILIPKEIVPFLKYDGYISNIVIDLKGHVFLKETSRLLVETVSQALKNYVKSGHKFIDIPKLLKSFSGDM